MNRLARSFGFAFSGIGYLLRTQRNARIELAIGIGAIATGIWLHISRGQWTVVVITIAMVLSLEGINTAIEAIVDLASPEFHPLAKVAKDVAAGMVLLVAIASIAVGLLVFGPPLWAKW